MKKLEISLTPVFYPIPFSFKDPKDLRANLVDSLREIIKPSNFFTAKYGNADLTFILVLERKTKELKVLGPTSGNELVDYTIWLPYKRIKNSANYKVEYLKVLKEGMLPIFKKYKFEISSIEKVFSELEKKYVY